MIHTYFGPCENDSVEGLPAATVRGMPKALVTGVHEGMRAQGVDLQSYTSGVTSSAHGDEEVSQTLGAFEATVQSLLAQGLLPR